MEKTERLNLLSMKQRSTLHKHHVGRQNLACCETLNKLLQRCFTRSLSYAHRIVFLGLIISKIIYSEA